MKIIKNCRGCGAVLQTIDQEQVGYVINMDHDLCVSCYKLKHYGIDLGLDAKEDSLEIANDSLVVVITSVINLQHLFMNNLNNLGKNLKFLYIINQVDLLDFHSLEKISKNVLKKIRNKPDIYDVIYMSALNKKDINNLKEYLLSTKFKQIYFYGAQNSGKTTIINGLTGAQAATGLKAGLTHKQMTYILNDKKLIDLPGIKRNGVIEDLLTYDSYKEILPNKKIKVRNFQIMDNQYLEINALFKIKANQPRTIIFYLNENLKITRRNIKSFTKEQDFTQTTYKTDNQSQINLSNLGFIHVKGINQITIIYNKKLSTEISRRLF